MAAASEAPATVREGAAEALYPYPPLALRPYRGSASSPIGPAPSTLTESTHALPCFCRLATTGERKRLREPEQKVKQRHFRQSTSALQIRFFRPQHRVHGWRNGQVGTERGAGISRIVDAIHIIPLLQTRDTLRSIQQPHPRRRLHQLQRRLRRRQPLRFANDNNADCTHNYYDNHTHNYLRCTNDVIDHVHFANDDNHCPYDFGHRALYECTIPPYPQTPSDCDAFRRVVVDGRPPIFAILCSCGIRMAITIAVAITGSEYSCTSGCGSGG